MNDTLPYPDEPPRDLPPEWQRAARIALRLFTQRYPCPDPDPREWQHECQQEAYVAIALQADQYRCPNPPPADPTRHQILWLANHAYNALRRFWHQETSYYQHTVPMRVQDEAGQELEWGDTAEAKVSELLERLFCEQLWERLLLGLEAVDEAILTGLADGRCQVEIAQELGISQQAVSKRLQKIRRLARGILEELG